MRRGTPRLHLHASRTAISPPPSLRGAVTPLLLRAATAAPAGILPAHLPVACRRSVLPATSACSPPPRHEAVSWCWEQREQERRGVLGPLCLVPWQAPPLHNAIELFGGAKRPSAQPLGSPMPFSPRAHRAAGGADLYSPPEALPSSRAESLSTSTCSKTPLSWSVCAGALAGCQQKGSRREERGEPS